MRKLSLIVSLFICASTFAHAFSEATLRGIVKEKSPAVVKITTYDDAGNIKSRGTGFFIDKDGNILTNRSYIKNASRVSVTLIDGKVYPVSSVVGEDRDADLLLLSAEIPDESILPLSTNITIPEVGERIIVISDPRGLEGTVADGFIVGIRKTSIFGRVLQISTPISPGSVGSPVFGEKGEVIGIAFTGLVKGKNLNLVIPAERFGKLKASKNYTVSSWNDEAKRLRSSKNEIIRMGWMLLLANKYHEAIEYIEGAIDGSTSVAEYYIILGDSSYNLGYHLIASEMLKKAINLEPDNAYAHYLLGNTYVKLRSYPEAVEAYKDAIRINPRDSLHHTALGDAYLKLQDYSKAIKAYKQAVLVDPSDAYNYSYLGRTYEKIKDYLRAIDAYEEAIRIDPYDASNYTSLGLAYLAMNDYSKALEACEQAMSIDSDDAYAHAGIAGVYLQLHKTTEAVGALKQAIELNPNVAAFHVTLGDAYMDKATDEFIHSVLDQQGDAIDGNLYKKAQFDYQKAIREYKEAIQLDPNNANAHYKLGLSYCNIEKKGLAMETYTILKGLDMELAAKLFECISP